MTLTAETFSGIVNPAVTNHQAVNNSWVHLEDAWLEVGPAITQHDLCKVNPNTKQPVLLGTMVLAQSVDAHGNPFMRPPVMKVHDPQADQARWKAMAPNEVLKEIEQRRTEARNTPALAAVPVLGKIATIDNRVMLQTNNGQRLILGEHADVHGKQSHRLHEVLSTVSNKSLLRYIILWRTSVLI